MSKPKYKVGDVVTIDTGWDRQVLRTITISEVSANHGAKGVHRYWGAEKSGQPHGFYENEIVQEGSARSRSTRSDWESPL
jgi:uncharacterized protein YodC (DUF2158 family)